MIVNPPIIGESIENGAALQELPADISQISGKMYWILMLEIEKMESKKLKTFQKLLEWVSSSPILSKIRAGRARAEEEMFTWKLTIMN